MWNFGRGIGVISIEIFSKTQKSQHLPESNVRFAALIIKTMNKLKIKQIHFFFYHFAPLFISFYWESLFLQLNPCKHYVIRVKK